MTREDLDTRREEEGEGRRESSERRRERKEEPGSAVEREPTERTNEIPDGLQVTMRGQGKQQVGREFAD